MKLLNKTALALAVLACGTYANAQGQSSDYASSWYVAPSINSMDADPMFNASNGDAGVGLRVGKALSPNWDVQMGITSTHTHNGDFSYRQSTLGADGLYLFSRGTWRPFLLAGAGFQRDVVSGPNGDVAENSPYISAGLGLQASITNQLSAQVDLRRNYGFHDGNLFGSDRNNNNYLTVGLNYAFEKAAR